MRRAIPSRMRVCSTSRPSISLLALEIGDDRADRGFSAGGADDLDERARSEGLHLDRRLVSLDLSNRLASFDLLPDRFQPGSDLPLLHVVAEVRHRHLNPHSTPFSRNTPRCIGPRKDVGDFWRRPPENHETAAELDHDFASLVKATCADASDAAARP